MREKEQKKQADKFWEERDEEDIGEGLMDNAKDPQAEQRPTQATPSRAATGKVIGKLSSKNLSVLDKPTNMPEVPFSRPSTEQKDPGLPPNQTEVQFSICN